MKREFKMNRRDAGFLFLGAGIVIIFSCLGIYFEKVGHVVLLSVHEHIAVRAHREQEDSMIVVVGQKELHNKNWDIRRSNSNLFIKDLSTKQLNDQAQGDIVRILEDTITEKRKSSYATIKLDDLASLNLGHPRNNDMFHILNFEDNHKYWSHPRKKEIDAAQWRHYIKNNYEAPRERYFTIEIPEMQMLFIAYESGTRLQMVAITNCPGVLNDGDEDTSRNLLPNLRARALDIKTHKEKK
jgi:hypothetical protein